jgi:hypothetical protein
MSATDLTNAAHRDPVTLKTKVKSPKKSGEGATIVYSYDNGDIKRLMELLAIAKEPARDNDGYLEFRKEQLKKPAEKPEILRFEMRFSRNEAKTLLSTTIRGPSGAEGTINAEELTIGGDKVMGICADTVLSGIRVLLGTPEQEFPKLFKLRGLGEAANVDNGKKTRQVDVVQVQRCDACGEVITKDPVSTKGTVMGHTIVMCAKSAECTRRAKLDVCGTLFDFRVASGKLRVDLAANPGCIAYLVNGDWQATPAAAEEAASGDDGAESDPDDLPIVPPRKACEVAVCSWASEPTETDDIETCKAGEAAKADETDDKESAKSDMVIEARAAEVTEVVVCEVTPNAECDLAFFEDSKTVPMVVEDAASTASESSVASSAAAASESSASSESPGTSKKQKHKQEEIGDTEQPAKKQKKEKKPKSGAEPSDPVAVSQAHERVYTVTDSQLKACYEELGDFIPHNLFGRVKEIIKMRLLQTPVQTL